MQVIHYVMLACAALAAGLTQTQDQFPPASLPYIKATMAVCVLLTAVLGAISPSASLGKEQAAQGKRA
jgi:hypothetical protein